MSASTLRMTYKMGTRDGRGNFKTKWARPRLSCSRQQFPAEILPWWRHSQDESRRPMSVTKVQQRRLNRPWLRLLGCCKQGKNDEGVKLQIQKLRATTSFTLYAASHQIANGFRWGFFAMQNFIHLFGDWHLDAAGASQPNGGLGGKHAFRDRTVHAGDNVGQLAAAP